MIHFEFLIEDQSGATFLSHFLPKLGSGFTSRIIPYRGIGRIPAGLRPGTDAKKRILLDQLPRLISGYGKTFASDPPEYKRVVIVICDLDNRDKLAFLREIEESLSRIITKPTYYVCPAIEEGEAWLLGDKDAVFTAYPRAISAPINTYSYDSICGTWEKLADSLYAGGSKALKNQHYSEIGKQKNNWAKNITPHIQIDRNQSPSLSELIASICKEMER